MERILDIAREGKTVYLDEAGNEISQQEYEKLQGIVPASSPVIPAEAGIQETIKEESGDDTKESADRD